MEEEYTTLEHILYNSKYAYDIQRCIATKLNGKWQYACRRYREEHPQRFLALCNKKPTSSIIDYNPGNLLPLKVAEQKINTWIPWALQQIKNDCDRIISRFSPLNVEQLKAVADEPVDITCWNS